VETDETGKRSDPTVQILALGSIVPVSSESRLVSMAAHGDRSRGSDPVDCHGHVMGDAAEHDEVSNDLPLTRREWEIARLLALGLSNRAIAERLSISPATVHNHLNHIYDKLGLRGRVQLALWVARHQAGSSQSENEPTGR